MNQFTQTLIALGSRPIAYNPAFARITGSVTAGVLLSQLVYWWSAVHGREFYKTDAELMEETAMGLKELANAKKRLISMGLIKCKRKGIPPKTYYILHAEKLQNEIINYAQKAQLYMPKSDNSTRPKGINITENTTEIKTESYAPPAVPATASLDTLRAGMEKKKLAAQLNAKDTPIPPPVAAPPPLSPVQALINKLQQGAPGEALQMKMRSSGAGIKDLQAFSAWFITQPAYAELTDAELVSKIGRLNAASLCARAGTFISNGMKGQQAAPRKAAQVAPNMMQLPG
jgi:hypothetical protein